MSKHEPSRTLEELVKAHQKLKDEPLHLALLLQDPRRPKDLVLFEVIGKFGGGHIDPNKRFVEVAMSANSAVVLPEGGELRLVLTSPEELRVAIDKGWPMLERLKSRHDVVAVLYADALGKKLKPYLHAA